MISLLGAEHRRFWRKPIVLFLFVMCLCINIALICRDAYQNDSVMGQVTPEEYKAVYEEIETLTQQELEAVISDLQEKNDSWL